MAIEHRNIPEDGLHEPKGVSTAASNRVYVSDGDGSGEWSLIDLDSLQGDVDNTTPSGRYLTSDGSGGVGAAPGVSHGSMTVTGNSTLFAVTASSDSTLRTTSDYKLFSGTGAPLIGEVLRGVTFSSDRLTVPDTGVYKLDLWAQIESFPSSSAKVAVRYRVNGSTFSTRYPKVKSNANNDSQQLFGFGLVELNAGDYIQIYFASTHSGDLEISNLNATMTLVI